MKILVTGAAGFIGFHLCKSLVTAGHVVVGLDNINDYYDINLKYGRLAQLGILREQAQHFKVEVKSTRYPEALSFMRLDVQNREEVPQLFKNHSFDLVCNLAAQAGVRHSIDHPEAYIDSNVVGFLNILECCRHYKVKRLIYASSSSVYGNSDEVPFTEDQRTDKPISLYAATKVSNELMAHTYTHLFGIETVGLRFFTVYGPWGRPDMATFLFTKSILEHRVIQVFNKGKLSRDFTFIDDIISALVRVCDAPYCKQSELLNIGNSAPVNLLDFITTLEEALGRTALKEFLPKQDGDVDKTWASIEKIKNKYGFESTTSVQEGVYKFVDWYRSFYKL